ncbi:MAG: LamG domain-containing protein, partial [Planctomycetota bacterium]
NNEETYDIEVDGTDQFVFLVRDVNGNKYSVPEEDEDDEDGKNIWTDDWIHLAGTYDGNTVKSYVNGELFGSTDANFVVGKGWTLSQDTTGLAIGSQAESLDNEFEGTVDDVRVYDYALSQAEVRWLATDGTGYVPLTSPYNIYDKEAPGKQAINFKDFAMLLEDWLEEILYP